MINITFPLRINSSKKGTPFSIPLIIVALVASFVVFMPIFSIPALAQNVATPYCTTTGSYQVCTDQTDYSPTLTVHIAGFSFAPDSSYLIKVTRPNGSIVTGDGSFGTWPTAYDYVTTDSNGTFLYNYVLDGIGGTYEIQVLDSGNNTLATATFTDKVPTATALNPITTPLGAGQTNVAFSGQVTKKSGTDDAPNGNVELHYSATCDQGTSGTLLAIAYATGNFSGTFNASSSGIYQFWAYYVGNDGHNPSSSDCQTITIKSSQTITVTTHAPTTAVYGSNFTVSATASSGLPVAITTGGTCSGSGTGSATITMTSGTGTCTAYFDQAGDATHNAATQVSESTTVEKTTATILVTPYSVTYDGNAHTATGSATGVNGETLAGLDLAGTTHTNAGDYPSDAWTFAGDSNYNSASGTVHDSIAKADATIVVNGYSGIYDGNGHGATGTATGVGGVDLSSSLDLGLTFTNVPGGTAHWTFTGGTNYNDASGDVAIDINKADAAISVSGYSGTYDGNPHGVSGAATGVKGEDLSGSLNLGASFINVPGGTADWSFSGGINYNDVSGSVDIVISKADANIVVTPYNVPYDSNSHTATGTATGVKGESLSGLGLSGTTHTDVGDYTSDAWTFTDVTGNYNNAAGTVHDSIGIADQAIAFGSLSDRTYGDADFSVSATASSGLTVSFAASGSCSMADATTVHITGAGGCTITASQSGDSNYNAAPDVSHSFNIDEANAIISVIPYSVTYDGDSHTATGTAKGVLNEDLSGLDLSGTTHANANAYSDTWTFTDVSGNYKDTSGTVTDEIKKADATFSVDGYAGIYDGNSHGATGSATGVKGETLSGLDLGASFTNVPGGTADWTFTGGTNYNDAIGSVDIVISKADPTIAVTPYSVTYDGNSHTATGSATGVKGETLSSLDLTGTTHTNAGTYTDTWTFTDVNGNYNDANGIVNDKINSAPVPVVNTQSQSGGVAPAASLVSANVATHSPGATSTVIVQNGKVTLRTVSIIVDSICKETVTPTSVDTIDREGSATFTVDFDCKGIAAGNYPVTYSLQLLSGKIIASKTYTLKVTADSVIAPSIVILSTVSSNISPGETGTVVVTIQNSGNVSTSGNVTLSAPASLSVSPDNVFIDLQPGELKNVSFLVSASGDAGLPTGMGVLTSFASFANIDVPTSEKLNVSVNYQTASGLSTVTKAVEMNVMPRFPFILLVVLAAFAGMVYFYFHYTAKPSKEKTSQ